MGVLRELYSYDTLTFIRYKDENLGPSVRLSTGIVDPGFLLVRQCILSCGESMQVSVPLSLFLFFLAV